MFKIYERASDLPSVWNELSGENLLLRSEYLSRLEKLNPCNQIYYINEDKEVIFVSYQLRLDLFTFSKKLSLKVPVNIIGIPMSVSNKGYSAKKIAGLNYLSEYIRSLEGFYIILNTNEEELSIPRGNTLPTYRLPIRWNTIDEYIDSMRSHYRYRLKKAKKRFEKVKIQELENNRLFDEEMYSLYCNVYENSNEKLEKLSIDFFKEFPAKIIKLILEDEVIAFIQLMENGDELLFLFGGFKHSLNRSYDLYINMLLKIIEYAINKGFKCIELGQTAGETKSKLGALQSKKYMYVHHSNSIIHYIINKLLDKFSYNHYKICHNVFKENNNENSFSKMS